MTFRESELAMIEKALYAFLERKRPPEYIRPKLDFGFRISGQNVELVEIRPRWDNPSVYEQQPFARATFIRSQNAWKLFWRRADLKWHAYQTSMVETIDEVLAIVEKDEYGCFFG